MHDNKKANKSCVLMRGTTPNTSLSAEAYALMLANLWDNNIKKNVIHL